MKCSDARDNYNYNFTIIITVQLLEIIRNAETYVHKITYVPYLFFYMALGLDDFEVGKSISWAIGRDGPSKCIFLHQNH